MENPHKIKVARKFIMEVERFSRLPAAYPAKH